MTFYEDHLSRLNTGKKPGQKPVHEMFMTPVFSFRDASKMPDVPLAEGVNLGSLVKNDPDPMFIVRPLAINGAISENGLEYDDYLLGAIASQINGKRPPARNGHIPDDQKTWNAGVSVGRWVGAVRVGDTVYGKCYIYPGTSFYADMRAAEAAGGEISNSIFGDSDYVDCGNGMVRAANTVLETVDFVPPERAALKALGGDFEVTSEMGGNMAEEHDDVAADLDLLKRAIARIKPEDVGVVHEMLREAGHMHKLADMHRVGCAECSTAETQRFREASPEETYQQLSEAQRSHIAECYAKEKGNKLTPMAEVSQTLSEMGKQAATLAEMQRTMAEMQKTIKAYERQEFENTLDKTIDALYPAVLRTAKHIDGQNNVKRIHRTLALAEMAGMAGGQATANIQAAVEKTWNDSAKNLSEMNLAAAGGPAVVAGQTISLSGGATQDTRRGFDPKKNRFTDEFVQDAYQISGLSSRRATGGAK